MTSNTDYRIVDEAEPITFFMWVLNIIMVLELYAVFFMWGKNVFLLVILPLTFLPAFILAGALIVVSKSFALALTMILTFVCTFAFGYIIATAGTFATAFFFEIAIGYILIFAAAKVDRRIFCIIQSLIIVLLLGALVIVPPEILVP